jgi:hypothetical protein
MSRHVLLLVVWSVLFGPALAACGPQPATRIVERERELGFTLVRSGPVATDRASSGGVSWVDVDGDGDLDLYVSNGYDVSADEPVPQCNRLYLNDGTGAFTRVESGALVDGDEFSSGSTWADFDNDGDLDCFVANQQDQDNSLYRNDGDGRFTRLADAAPSNDGGHSYAASWVDVDGDGWLDLYVANGGMSHTGVNFAYRNLGDGRFERVTDTAIVGIEAASCAVAWADFDDDGDVDLYVANTRGDPAVNADELWRNDGGWRFTRMTDGSIGDARGPSSAAVWGDIDGDGDLDLFVATMWGLANRLYRNDAGVLVLLDTALPSVDGTYTYGADLQDWDNDGDLDLLLANWGAAPSLYLNDGTGGFELARAGDLGRVIAYGASVASGDVDGDGDLDVAIANWPNEPGMGEPNHLFLNDGVDGHWLRVRLVGDASNRSAIGARVTVAWEVDGVRHLQTREVTAHSGFRAQSALSPHFGLGTGGTVDEVVVRWPSGRVDRLGAVSADREVEIVETR